jgi:UDP-N-acetylmuramoyl-tripeptide--D-alanyl-D-alanine ligase
MSMWTADEINKLFFAHISASWAASGISIDTRTLKPGDIYVALKGAKLDGHDYVEQAVKAGAAAVMVDHPVAYDVPQIVVPDVLEGLRVLAAAARARTTAKIVGITGSVGKTSTKEALKFALSDQAPTYATPRSFNNHWGLPLALAMLPSDVVYGVLEMGMNNLGEIASHTELAKPHVAYITNIEGIHVGKLGSIANIAKAKSEIFQGLQPGGIAIINMDTNESSLIHEAALASGASQVWRFGRHADADIRLISSEESSDHQIVHADIHGEKLTYRLNLHGGHWAMNSIGILAVVKALGADVKRAAEKLSDFSAVAGRGQIHTVDLPDGKKMIVIDESYNAGPVSMRAALEVLRKVHCDGSCRRIAVLGDMLELGDTEKAEHINLKDDIIANGVDLVFTSGERMAELAKVLPTNMRGSHVDDPKMLAQEVCAQARPGDIYMVKGSRGGYHANGRMYAVVESLLTLNQKQS